MILKNHTYNTLLRSMNIPADAEHVLGHHNCDYEDDGLMVTADDDLIPPEHSRWMAQHELLMYGSQVKTFLHDMAARQASRGFGPKPMEFCPFWYVQMDLPKNLKKSPSAGGSLIPWD